MKKSLLRKHLVASTLALVALTFTLTAAPITGFDDIQLWTGTGSNRAGLVIDWNDGTTQDSFAWGYRWSGSATGEDLFRAIAGALAESQSSLPFGPPVSDGVGDPALSLFIRNFSFGPSVDRVAYLEPGGPAHDQDSANFNNGFWSYWLDEGTGTYPDTWTSSMVGFGDRTLADGSWDAFSYVPDFNGVPPSAAIAAIPEPRTIGLLLLALATIALTLHPRHRAKL
jgi:hypothetical protein